MKISGCLNIYLIEAFRTKKREKLKKSCYDIFNFFLVKSKAVSYAFYKGRDMVNGLKMVHNKFIIHVCVQ